jgi:hypothetical protein
MTFPVMSACLELIKHEFTVMGFIIFIAHGFKDQMGVCADIHDPNVSSSGVFNLDSMAGCERVTIKERGAEKSNHNWHLLNCFSRFFHLY